jgi:Ca2+-binding RTX toxin-like protein
MKSNSACARAYFTLARVLRRGVLPALAAGLIAVPSAGAVTYPVDGGNGFDQTPESWSGTAASCSPSLLCAESNFHSTTQGNPAGSLVSRLDVLVNAGELFQGQATWQSPPFRGTTIGSGSIRYDRQIDTSGLLTLSPVASVEPVLVNETTGVSTSLGSESLSSANSAFALHTIAAPEDTLEIGDRYHLELRSATATTNAQVGLTGSVSVRFDNVALKLKSQGPGGSSGSDGVEFPKPPLDDDQADNIASQVNLGAQAGHGPGGSLLSRQKCTILGTPGADRITGSKGNDVICGLGGNDKIKGRGGKDVIDGGGGKDRLAGNGKVDTIVGLAGKDRLKGGPGRDRVGAGKGGDNLAGNGGNDRLSGSTGNDRLAGGAGRDRINGGPGRDRVTGAVGRDRLSKVERRG